MKSQISRIPLFEQLNEWQWGARGFAAGAQQDPRRSSMVGISPALLSSSPCALTLPWRRFVERTLFRYSITERRAVFVPVEVRTTEWTVGWALHAACVSWRCWCWQCCLEASVFQPVFTLPHVTEVDTRFVFSESGILYFRLCFFKQHFPCLFFSFPFVLALSLYCIFPELFFPIFFSTAYFG